MPVCCTGACPGSPRVFLPVLVFSNSFVRGSTGQGRTSCRTSCRTTQRRMIDTLSANLSSDFDSIVRRSAAGVASCKEVLGLMRARQATEEAYGQALLKQGRSAAGLMGATPDADRTRHRCVWALTVLSFVRLQSVARAGWVSSPSSPSPRRAPCCTCNWLHISLRM